MLARLFPRQFDNAYRGSLIAAWLLGALVLMKGVMGHNAMVFTRMVAIKADGIPLDSYGPEGSRMLTIFFGLWGLWQLLFCLLGLLALIRYRAMIPLILLLLLAEQLARKAIFALHPAAGAAAPTDWLSFPLLINLGFTAALLLAFGLSLTVRRGAAARPA